METILAQFEKRLKERKEELGKLQNLLKTMPAGNLVIMHPDGHARFYTGSGKEKKYLRKEKKTLISDLAQRGYYEQLEKALAREVKVLSAFLDRFTPDEYAMVYQRLSEDRKKLVIPFYETDEHFIASWKAEQELNYKFRINSYEIPGELRTKGGERVRSKSEKIIADALYDHGIPYYYELPLRIRNNLFYPDFTALNVKTRKTWYWEHLGLADSPEYMEKAVIKLDLYRKEGIWPGDGLIQSFESAKHPLSTDAIEKSIEKNLL